MNNITNQINALVEMSDAFNDISTKYGPGAAEFGATALVEARWLMNTMIKSPYADLIAETLASANHAVNYMQRVMASPTPRNEDDEIMELVKFGLPTDVWDKDAIASIIKSQRQIVSTIPIETWNIRDYRVDMKPETD